MMKLYAIVCFLSTVVALHVPEWEPEDEYTPLSSAIAHLSVEEAANVSLRATDSDILYHFFCQSNSKHSLKLRTTTITKLKHSAFDANKTTLFVVHGWKNHNESEINHHIREAIMDHHDINLFVVDWSILAGKSYGTAQGSVKKVGEYVAIFVRSLKRYFHLSLSKLKFVGYSLGAHVSGNAGQALGGKVDRITGLDPAGPYFKKENTDNRLDPTDAQYVQVIHTNGGLLGYFGPLGHADFYPNGGKSQPGCGWDLAGSCAHARSYAYYKESLSSDRFVAQLCDSYEEFTDGNCLLEDTAIMGRFEPDKSVTGTFYLDTFDRQPYAKGWTL